MREEFPKSRIQVKSGSITLVLLDLSANLPFSSLRQMTLDTFCKAKLLTGQVSYTFHASMK